MVADETLAREAFALTGLVALFGVVDSFAILIRSNEILVV